VILAVIFVVAAGSLVLVWRKCHSDGAITRMEAFRARMRIIFLALAVCSLCAKAVVHTYRHFNPPAAPVIGP
jgi:uncharacterized membrane protein